MANDKTIKTPEEADNFVFGASVLESSLDALRKAVHDGNVRRGFYDKEPSVCEQLALIMTEGAEAIEADRRGKHADIKKFDEEVLKLNPDDPEYDTKFVELFKTHIKDTVEDEIADILIRVMDYCGWKDINITKHVLLKLNYNSTRPYKHGKQY